MKDLYDNYAKFMKDRHETRRANEQIHYAAHCDQRVLHLPEQCEYCSHAEYDDLHEYRARNKILHTGEAAKSGWWPCPAEHERGLKSVNSWGGNTAKPVGCKCSWFQDDECPIHPPNQ